MSRRAAALLIVAVLGPQAAPAAPAAPEWRCRQGRVELIVGGTSGCPVAPPEAPASAAYMARDSQRERDRRDILAHELRQEQALLAGYRRDGWPADPAVAQRVHDNINALMRELSRPTAPR